MAEQPVASGQANVLVYDSDQKKWEPQGPEKGKSRVTFYSNPDSNTFRIVGRNLADKSVAVNSNILRNTVYNPANDVFHQWRDARGVVYGLHFSEKDKASAFLDQVEAAIKQLNTPKGAVPPPAPRIPAPRPPVSHEHAQTITTEQQPSSKMDSRHSSIEKTTPIPLQVKPTSGPPPQIKPPTGPPPQIKPPVGPPQAPSQTSPTSAVSGAPPPPPPPPPLPPLTPTDSSRKHAISEQHGKSLLADQLSHAKQKLSTNEEISQGPRDDHEARTAPRTFALGDELKNVLRNRQERPKSLVQTVPPVKAHNASLSPVPKMKPKPKPGVAPRKAASKAEATVAADDGPKDETITQDHLVAQRAEEQITCTDASSDILTPITRKDFEEFKAAVQQQLTDMKNEILLGTCLGRVYAPPNLPVNKNSHFIITAAIKSELAASMSSAV
eukprot:gene3324-6008_t